MKLIIIYMPSSEYLATFTTRALIIHEDQLLVVRHANAHSTHYALPGGKLEWDESLIEGLQREIHEELNVEANIDSLALVHEFVYELELNPKKQKNFSTPLKIQKIFSLCKIKAKIPHPMLLNSLKFSG